MKSQNTNRFLPAAAVRLIDGPWKAIYDKARQVTLPDVLDKIFVPFFTTKTSGSSIGLSLCKQIMTLHEGSINVKSEVGKGSSFILTFPK